MEKTVFWNPDENEYIRGIYVDKLSNVGRYKTTLYKIQDDNIIYCVWGKMQLDSIMKTARIGDNLQLKYCGVEKTKDDNKMKRYELEILNE